MSKESDVKTIEVMAKCSDMCSIILYDDNGVIVTE